MAESSWSEVAGAFDEWRDFEVSEYYPQTVYFSQDEAMTLTREDYFKWLREMEEIHIPRRLRRCEDFFTSLENFRGEIGTADYGAQTVEVVEGLLRASREAKESLAGVLDACSQYRLAMLEENAIDAKEWYTLLTSREENMRRLIAAISEAMGRVKELLSS